jgi:peptide/nickel transport system permease protein
MLSESIGSPQVGLKGEIERNRDEGQWLRAWNTLRRNPFAMFGLLGILAVVLISFLARWIAPYDPIVIDYEQLLQPPSIQHLFGTDNIGRDILSRVMWGGRESIMAAFFSVLITMVGGTLLGLLSGYRGGWVDSLIMRIVDILLAFPSILLLLSIIAAIGPSLTTVLIALGISSIPGYTRMVRGSVLAAKNYEYVTAAIVVGGKNSWIMMRHILPNIVAPLIIYNTLGFGGAIMITAGLSYLGLGAQPPSPEWGAMLNDGRAFLRDAWWMSAFPGLLVFFLVFCINLLGDGLRDALDPKTRR